jgi:prepilin-type processing-associated H-X9-DG protein
VYRKRAPVAIFSCPGRRDPKPYPNLHAYYIGDSDGNTFTIQPPLSARTDYAGNSGSQLANEWQGGPSSLAEGDAPTYPWPNDEAYNGIFYVRSWTTIQMIQRGSSNTILVGEKYLNPEGYSNGKDYGDNEAQYTGFNNDINRTTYYPPLRDQFGMSDTTRFGSAHTTGLNILYADGSVRFVNYDIDPEVFLLSGQRY